MSDRRAKFQQDPFDYPLDMSPVDTAIVGGVEVGEEIEISWVEHPPQLLLRPRTRTLAQVGMRRRERILVQ